MYPRLILASLVSSVPLLAQTAPITVPPLPFDLDKPPTLTLPGQKPTTSLRPVVPTSVSGPLPTSSTSAKGTFIIHGGDLALRTAFSHDCEEIAEELQRLLHDPAPQQLPVVIVLKTPTQLDYSKPPVVAEPRQIPGGFHLQLTVQARPGLTSAAFRTELLKLLVAERILRGHQEVPDTTKRIMPDWLITGVLEALEIKNRTRPSALFAAILKSGKIYGIEDILDTSAGQMDSFTETLYRTSAAALVLMLLEQPEGNMCFAKFLNELPVDKRSDRELLTANFPKLAVDKASLDKWWALQLANLARPSIFETLSPSETAALLTEALTARVTVVTETPVASSSSRRSSSSTPAEEEPEETPDTKQDGRSPSLFSRLFTRKEGADSETKPEAKKTAEPKKPEPKSEEKPKEKPKPAPAKVKKKEEEGESGDKPSILNRLFRRDPAKAEEKPKKEAAASHSPAASSLALAFATAQATPQHVLAQIVLFKKKTEAEQAKADDLASKEAAVKAAKKEAAAKEAAAKAAAKELQKREEEVNSAKEKALKEAAREQEKKEAEAAKMAEKEPEKKEEPAPSKPEPSAPRSIKRSSVVTLTLSDHAKILQRSDSRVLFAQMSRSLATLAPRAHPALRPVIGAYIAFIADLSAGKTQDAAAKFAALSKLRDSSLAKAKEAQGYLDWYQANHPSAKSSTQFQEYLNVEQLVKRELKPRTDPVTLFFDEWEKKQK